MGRRVLIAEFKHETNSFCTAKTGKPEYEDRYLKLGEEIITFFRGVKVELGGIIDACAEEELTMVPVVAANAMPSGPVTRDVFEFVKAEILSSIKKEADIEGIILSLHGAMVLEDAEDGEGELLTVIRELVGPKMPIMVSLDLHANVTKAMVESATALFAYDTYPHIDQYDRGYEAAKTMAATLRGEVKPVMRMRQVPLLSPTLESAKEPVKSLVEMAHHWEAAPDVISVSVVHGFPWSDIYEAGYSFLADTDGDGELAQKIVDQLGNELLADKDSFIKKMVPVEEAIQRGMEAPEGPVVLADVADNPGGGSPGDGTHILRKLVEMGAKNVAFALIVDPAVVEKAVAAGVRSTITVALGGKTEPLLGEPLEVKAVVKTIVDGKFVNKGPMGHGLQNDIGRTVVLDINGIEVVVPEKRIQPWDPEIMRRVGIEPTEKQILVVKSALHYRAAFGPLAKEIIEVDAPGLTALNLEQFAFKRVRRPVFPLDQLES